MFGVDHAGAPTARRGFPIPRPVAVAIPAKDESERLPKCLEALAGQVDHSGYALDRDQLCIAIFANNCSDDTADLARSHARRFGLQIRVVEACLPAAEAHAGNARRAAMDIAESWLQASERKGVILTTDADSRVPPLWIANNLAAIEGGADAVLGRVELDEEGMCLPEELHRRGQREGAYEALLTELSARVDPVPFNPWPHHATISGASLAVTREAYLRAGRLPAVPLGEDKAFVAELFRCDAKIRFSPEVVVTTSGRLKGRAPGGVADTLRLRCDNPEVTCDEALEPFDVAMKRAKWRARIRRLHHSGQLASHFEWAEKLGVPERDALLHARSATFGAAWSAIEKASPCLARRGLSPAELLDQITYAERVLAHFRKDNLWTPQPIDTELAISCAVDDMRNSGHGRDERVGSVVAR